MPPWPPPIDDRLLSLDASGQPTLHAGRTREGRFVFPPPAAVDDVDLVPLPREGRLWSWTIQRFRPKSPPYAGTDAFEPYAVGYVQLGDLVIVEARLTGMPPDGWRIGLPLVLVAEPFDFAEGGTRSTFAFAPVEEAA